MKKGAITINFNKHKAFATNGISRSAVNSAPISQSKGGRNLLGNAKIAQFWNKLQGEENVLRLDITVDDLRIPIVKEGKHLGYLTQN